MGWFDDIVEDVGEAFNAAGEAIGNAVDAAVDFVGDAVDTVVDTVGNAFESAAQVVTGTVESVVDLGETISDIASGEATGEALVEWFGDAVDNVVLDPIDTATGGAVDLDYDNGSFSGGLDFGVGSVSVAFGENGFEGQAEFDIGIASGNVGYNNADGFSAGGSLGVDFLPFPYAEGHIDIDPDGTVSIGGEVQANLPFVDASIGGEFQRDSDGSWSVGGGASVGLDLPFLDLSASASGEYGRNDAGQAYAGVEGSADFDGPLGVHGSAEGGVNVVRGDGATLVDVFGEVEGGAGGREFAASGGVSEEVTDQEIIDGVRGAATAVADGVRDVTDAVIDGVTGRALDGAQQVAEAADDLLGGRGLADSFEDGMSTVAVTSQTLVQDETAAAGAAASVAAEFDAEADATITQLSGVADTSDASDSFMPEPEPVPEPVTDFQQEIAAADAVSSTTDDIWDGLDN